MRAEILRLPGIILSYLSVDNLLTSIYKLLTKVSTFSL
nr:MAG TPA: hypothetical protein [Caudoviricetes sp.]